MKKSDYVLVLRTCKANMHSMGKFIWPTHGTVIAPDWKPTYRCGHGLHGWLWGEGDGGLGYANYSHAKWLVVRVNIKDLLHGRGDLKNKCKFRRGTVVFCGNRVGATDYIAANGGRGRTIIGATVTAKQSSIAAVGDYGTARSGTQGCSVAGGCGRAISGQYGIAVASHFGSATVGGRGVAFTRASSSTCSGGLGAALIMPYNHPTLGRRFTVGYVGENGIEPGVRYTLTADGYFIKAKQ